MDPPPLADINRTSSAASSTGQTSGDAEFGTNDLVHDAGTPTATRSSSDGASACTCMSSITNHREEDLVAAQLHPNAFALSTAENHQQRSSLPPLLKQQPNRNMEPQREAEEDNLGADKEDNAITAACLAVVDSQQPAAATKNLCPTKDDDLHEKKKQKNDMQQEDQQMLALKRMVISPSGCGDGGDVDAGDDEKPSNKSSAARVQKKPDHWERRDAPRRRKQQGRSTSAEREKDENRTSKDGPSKESEKSLCHDEDIETNLRAVRDVETKLQAAAVLNATTRDSLPQMVGRCEFAILNQLDLDEEEAKMELEEEAPPVPTPQSQPGLFFRAPGEATRQAQRVQFSTLGWALDADETATSASGTMQQQDQDAERVTDDVEAGFVGSNAPAESFNLAVALPVEEDPSDGMDLPQAQEFDTSNSANKAMTLQRVIFIGKVVALFLVLIVVVVLAAVLIRKDSPNMEANATDQSMLSPTPSPALSPESHVKSLLPNCTVSLIEQDLESPQHTAFRFVLDDPQFGNCPDWQIQQRCALVTFFCASKGQTWKENTGWLDCNRDECDWHSPRPQLSLVEMCTGKLKETAQISDSPCDKDGVFKHLTHCGNEVSGTLPPEVFELLPALVSVDLDPQGAEWFCNDIGNTTEWCGHALDSVVTGSIPSEIGLCSQLKRLSLADQRLSGPLLSNLGSLSLLEHLTFGLPWSR